MSFFVAMFHNKYVKYGENNTYPTRNDFIDQDLKANIDADIKQGKPLYVLVNDIKENPSFRDYCLYLSCILVDGSKAIVKVNHITPYVDVKITGIKLDFRNFGFNTNKIKEIINKHNENNTEYKNKIKDFNFYRVEGKPLIGYQENNECFIRIKFKSASSRNNFIDMAATEELLDTYNDDKSSYYRVVSRDHEINLASWNIINNYSDCNEMFKTEYKFEVSISDIQGVYNIEDTFEINDTIYKSDILKKDRSVSCCFDIEAYSPIPGRVPMGDDPRDDLFMICLTFQFINEPKSFLNVCIVDRPCSPQEDLYTIICKDEKEVLIVFSLIIGYLKPDFITEFNGSSYDWVFIQRKLEYYDYLAIFAENVSLSKLDAYNLKTEVIMERNFNRTRIKINAEKSIEMFNYKTFGFIPFDCKIILEKLFPNLENFKLNTFLKENNLQLKDSLKISDMFKFCELPDTMTAGDPLREGMKVSAHYCYIDSFSLHELLFKKNVILDNREIASVSYTSLSDSFYRADSMRVLNLVVNKCNKNKLFYRTKKEKGDLKTYKFPGAIVLDPKKGLVNIIMNIKDFMIYEKIDELSVDNMFNIISSLYNFIYIEFIGYVKEIEIKNCEEILIIYDCMGSETYINVGLTERINKEIVEIMKAVLNNYIQYVFKERIKYPVCALDFSSLYPSIIMTYNISPEYWVNDYNLAEELKQKNYELHNIQFKYGHSTNEEDINSWTIKKINEKDMFGLYPSILKYLFDERNKIKKILKPIDHEIERLNSLKENKYKEITQDGYNELLFNFNYYNSKQLGIKVLMNTFYGVLGTPVSPLFILELAGGVTSMGQYNLLLVKSFLENEKLVKIYYGDTDSLYFSCNDKHFKNETEMFFTGKLEREVYAETIINKSFKIVDDLAKDVNEYLINDNGRPFLKMAYEEVLMPAVFIVKKQYYGLPHENIANIDISDPNRKVFIRGLEVKKKGNSPVLIDVYTKMMKESLNVSNFLDLESLVNKYIEYMFTTNWNKVDFVKSKPYKPNKKNISVMNFVNRMKTEGYGEPVAFERFRYVVVKKYPYKYDITGKQTKLSTADYMEYLERAVEEDLEIDIMYYFNGELITQFARLLCCLDKFVIITNGDIDDDKTLNNCKTYITSISNKYNKSYVNKGKIFKDLYKKITSAPKSKYKNFDVVMSDVENLNAIVDKKVKSYKINVKDIIDTKNIVKYKQFFNSKKYSKYNMTIRDLDIEIIMLKNNFVKFEINLDDVILKIREEYNFMDLCKNENITKIEDIINDATIEKIVASDLKIDEEAYNKTNETFEKIISLSLEKKIYQDIYNYINEKLTGSVKVEYTKRTL